MRTRDYVQEYQDDIGTSGTVTYNLDFTDPITELLLGFDATNGASGNKNNPIERNISKIEIVDGGTVLWDAPGDVALSYAAHMANRMPVSNRTGAINDTPYQVIPLRFGRFAYDPELAFNPRAHRNPQLRVTFDEATVRAAGATGFVSDSFALTLIVRLMEDGPAPGGFLSLRDVYQFTSLASGDTRVEMPTDRNIRSFLLRVYESGTYFGSNISNVKLSANGGKFTPFDLYAWNLTDIMAEHFEPLDIHQYTITDNPETHQTWIAHDTRSSIRSHISGAIVGASSPATAQMACYHVTHANADLDGQPIHFVVGGWGFHNLMIYPFGRKDVIDDWYSVSGVNSLDLFLTNGNAGAEVNVGVEQLYTY